MAKYITIEREKFWQQYWQDNKIFKFNPDLDRPIFSIDTPPPTVSGKLHMGHVFSYTHAEVIARYRRLSGFNVFYPFGMDDNGLPTEKLVEQELEIKGSQLERKDFVEKCLETVGVYHLKYRDLWQSLGFSVDWDLEYSTISKEVQKMTQKNFLDFYKKGIIYKEKAPSLWCWVCQTSVAQAEVEDQSKPSVFYDISFFDEDKNEVIIATTRPELLPACVAVFINPTDGRYKKYLGKYLTTSLGDKVKVYADEKVAIDKGTGIVMCCTYGDETDLLWKKQNNLEEKIIIDKNGLFIPEINLKEMAGKKVNEGRRIIVDYLKSKNLIKKELPIVHDVGCHERCSTPIEIINTDQWFVKVLNIKKELLDLGNEIKWYPEYMKQRFVFWVENLKWDWCISRDRFYGISVPVFYCQKCGEIILPEESQLPVESIFDAKEIKCLKCNSETKGDNLVLDTWFTSGNSPEINIKSNQSLTKEKITIPMSLRPNAHDIIRTWDFYTIVMSYYKYNAIPWNEVMISGHILLRKGEKISKRTGGGNLRPEEQIALHGADAIRFAMCSSSLGSDGYYDEQEIENGKKLINKLFNAGNFCIDAIQNLKEPKEDQITEAFDLWILEKSRTTAEEMTKYFDNYDYSHARNIVYQFFWEFFCDYYLEIIKKRIYDLPENDERKISCQTSLYFTLQNILIMASPFLPHITEEIYQGFNKKEKSVHWLQWPAIKERMENEIFNTAEELVKVIEQIRKLKKDNNLGLSTEIDKLEISGPDFDKELVKKFEFDLKAVSKAKVIVFKNASEIKISL